MPGRDILLLNRNQAKCRVCFGPLTVNAKYDYIAPFTAPATWCDTCKRQWWEQSKDRETDRRV